MAAGIDLEPAMHDGALKAYRQVEAKQQLELHAIPSDRHS